MLFLVQYLDSDFDVVYVNTMSPSQQRFNISSPRGEWQRQLIQDFPSEKEAIIKFFNMANKITTYDFSLSVIIVKVLPLWFVRVCDRLGLIQLFSPFFFMQSKGTLDKVIKVGYLFAQMLNHSF